MKTLILDSGAVTGLARQYERRPRLQHVAANRQPNCPNHALASDAQELSGSVVCWQSDQHSANVDTLLQLGRGKTVPPATTSMSSREFNQGTGVAKQAARNGPVYITDRGTPAFVLLSIEHYRQLIDKQPSLADLLCRTTGVGDIDFEIPDIDEIAQPAVFD